MHAGVVLGRSLKWATVVGHKLARRHYTIPEPPPLTLSCSKDNTTCHKEQHCQPTHITSLHLLPPVLLPGGSG
jgi:hypothetical protein